MDLTSKLWRSCAALAAGAMLLVFLGPTLDHHYAERQFGHSHVSLGSASASHVHFHEDAQGHSQDHSTKELVRLMLDGDETAPSHGTVYLTSYDGIGYVFAGLSGPLADQDYSLRGPGDGSMLSIFATEVVNVGAFVPIPKKPPRV